MALTFHIQSKIRTGYNAGRTTTIFAFGAEHLPMHAAVLTTRVVSGAGPGTSAPPNNDFLRARITSTAAPSRSSASPTSERVTGTAICQVGCESPGGEPDGASSLARNGDGMEGTGGGGGGDGGGIPSAAQ